MRSSLFIVLVFCFFNSLISADDLHNVSKIKGDFERAANFDKRFRSLINLDNLEPHRIGEDGKFWFQTSDTFGVKSFFLVDPSKKEKMPLFNAEQMRKSLLDLKAPKEAVTKLTLEKLQVDVSLKKFSFILAGQGYEANLKPLEVKRIAKEIPALEPLKNLPKLSEVNGKETKITFENNLEETIEIFWLSFEGKRVSYGKIESGQKFSQRTFENQIWLVIDSKNKLHNAFRTGADNSIARIQQNQTVPKPMSEEVRKINPQKNKPSNSSPDGNWQVIIRDFNLFLNNLNNPNNEIKLTNDADAKNGYRGAIYWSPDSSSFIAMKSTPGEGRVIHMIESTPKTQLQPKLISFNYDKPGDKLEQHFPHLFQIKSKKEIIIDNNLFNNPWSISQVRWKADSSRFTFLYNQRGHQVLRVLSIDGQSGGVSTLIEESSKTFVEYSGKTYFHWLKDENEFLWMSERDGWNHLYLADGIKGGIKKQLTKGEWVVRNVERVDETGGEILLKVMGIHSDMDPYFYHYALLDMKTTTLTPLTKSKGTHKGNFNFHPDYFLTTWSRVDHAPVTELRNAKTGELILTLDQHDDSKLKEANWPRPIPFSSKGRDGKTEIYGIIMKPSNFNAKVNYPVIEQIYAGPHDFHVPKDFRVSSKAQAMAELGFIVVQIDGMGTSGRSKAFHDVCWKNLADAGFLDRILWMKAAAKMIPQMNLEKVGIYGGSAGGQNAMRALIDHGDFYKAAAADCGCHDNRMDKVWWNELWMGYPIDSSYEKSSNFVHAHRMQGKILLTVGELDRNVDPASTMQVADALIKAKKDFELIVIPGGGHGSGESPFAHRRRQEFFLEQLWGK